MLQVIDISFNDRDSNWSPDDTYDFDEWMTATIGENGGGNDYQLCICTNMAISRLEDKRHIFVLAKWDGIDDLKSKINQFISEKLNNNVKDDPYQLLSKYWYWEYEGYNS